MGRVCGLTVIEIQHFSHYFMVCVIDPERIVIVH